MGIHDPAVVEELLHSGIYVLDDSIDSNALIELQSNVESRFGEIKIVYIILTDVCNLRCSYCAVKNIADKNHVIDTYSLSKEKYTKFVKNTFLTPYRIIFLIPNSSFTAANRS